MRSRWEVSCEFRNGFMQENGAKRTIEIISSTEKDAKAQAMLKMCERLGLSTMMHRYVSVKNIKNIGKA